MSATGKASKAAQYCVNRLRDYASANRATGCGCGDCSQCAAMDLEPNEAEYIADVLEILIGQIEQGDKSDAGERTMRTIGVLLAMDMAANCCEVEEYTNTADELRKYRSAVQELIEAARDFQAKTFAPGAEDFSANEAVEFATAHRRLTAALTRIESNHG